MADFLEFEDVLDGKCQILSDGGKLTVMHNRHPEQAISFRLIRMFVDIPQGRATGSVEPDAKPVKLGCNRVDGRRQYWVVERANYETE